MGHTLDLVFANKNEFDLPCIKPIDYSLSDHFPLVFNIPSFDHVKTPATKLVHYRNLKSIDRATFSVNFRNSLDSKLQCNSNIDCDFSDHVNIFSECAVSELDKVAPLKSKSISMASQTPWMDEEYRSERILRRRLERTWRASGLMEDKLPFIVQRKKCAQLSISKRTKFYSDIVQNSEGDQRALFKVVTTVMDKRKTCGNLPNYESANVLANKFNDFYSNKVLKIRNNIKPSNLPCDFRQIFSGTMMKSLKPTTVDELRDIIKDMGIKTSSLDPLPGTLLKDIIDDLLPYLCDIVNKSLNTGSVEGVKDSIIVPLLKKFGLDPETLNNYRPVTNEEYISKLTEKVVTILTRFIPSTSMHIKYFTPLKRYC